MSGTRVAIFDATTSRFELKQLSQYQPQLGEILVKVTCCTICGSDLHTYFGRRSGPSPVVLGHEIVGVVESWNGDVPLDFCGNSIQVGQRITWSLSVGCEHCMNCQDGLPQKCDSLFKYGHSLFDGLRPTGGLAEHCVLVSGTPVFQISDSLSDKVACPANCATATVMAAVRLVEEVKPLEDRTVLVTGLGMLGLTACAVCSEKGSRVIAVDTNPQRRTLAKAFGASEVYDTTDVEVSELVKSRRCQAAFELSGASQAIELCVSSLHEGGVALLAGSVFPGSQLALDPETMVRRVLTIRGIHNYRPDDLADALSFLERSHNKFPFESLVSEQFSLAEAGTAFEMASTGKAVRVAIVP